MSPRLSAQNYKTLKNTVELPHYTPAEHASGIVHLGIGAFHKAHQAVYTDTLLNLAGGDWRIQAVSLRQPTARDQLNPQNGLYTLLTKTDGALHWRIIGAVEAVWVARENPQAVINLLAQPAIKVVTLTITEKGYYQIQGALDLSHPDIQQDLNNLTNPITMPGFIVAACAQRMRNQQPGFTLLSCDNLAHNGRVTRAVILAFAEQIDAALAQWINHNIAFCSSMVDRIVPATTAESHTAINTYLGLDDYASVVSEPFSQWIIEDNFCSDRPHWELAGALVVKDVTPYENLKLRLLNGGHSLLAYIGFLLGYDFIHQAMANPDLRQLLQLFMDSEVTPVITAPEGIVMEHYKATICARFANNLVPYKTAQVASDGSQKLPQRWLATANELIAKHQQPRIIPFALAAWLRYLTGVSEAGEAYTVNDPQAEQLTPLARAYHPQHAPDIQPLLAATGIFSRELLSQNEFMEGLERWLASIHTQGMEASLGRFLLST